MLAFQALNSFLWHSPQRSGPIRSGEIDYLIEPSDPPEAGSCLTCISVPRTDVVLDA